MILLLIGQSLVFFRLTYVFERHQLHALRCKLLEC